MALSVDEGTGEAQTAACFADFCLFRLENKAIVFLIVKSHENQENCRCRWSQAEFYEGSTFAKGVSKVSLLQNNLDSYRTAL